jgi:hypothetical protein
VLLQPENDVSMHDPSVLLYRLTTQDQLKVHYSSRILLSVVLLAWNGLL